MRDREHVVHAAVVEEDETDAQEGVHRPQREEEMVVNPHRDDQCHGGQMHDHR